MAESSSPRARRELSERCVVIPTMKRKNGKIRSVGVHPFHSACSSGGKIALHVPGLLTSSMPATVRPRKTSSESRRSRLGASGATVEVVASYRVEEIRAAEVLIRLRVVGCRYYGIYIYTSGRHSRYRRHDY